MKRKNLILILLTLTIFSRAQTTWEIIAKERSIKEISENMETLKSIAYSGLLMNQLWLTQSLDIDKTIAKEYITMSISPNTKLFNGKSFIDVMRTEINNSFQPKSKLGKEALAAGLDNATNSNGLVTSILNISPVGAAVSNVLSVVNGFLEKKGVFLFIKKLFAPNLENQIRTFESSMAPYLSFYGKLDNTITNSVSTYETYSKIINSDLAELENLYAQYIDLRDKVTGKQNSSLNDLTSFINNVPTKTITAEQFLTFMQNTNLQELIHISNQMKRKDIEMAYHYLSFNIEVQKHIANWMNELVNNPLTKDGVSTGDLKIIVDALKLADTNIKSKIKRLGFVIKERDNNSINLTLGEEIIKLQFNDNFFAPNKDNLKALNEKFDFKPFMK